MSEIKVGDLVMVVRWPCCGAHDGAVFRVATFWRPSEQGSYLMCRSCGRRMPESYALGEGSVERRAGAPIAWLKRLDPDALKDDVPTDEVIHA